jgi:hypothetical protein
VATRPGRRIPQPASAADEGHADPLLVAALSGYALDAGRRPEVLAALHRARVLVPVVAVPGEVETTAAGLTRDRSADIAVPLLGGQDGSSALPAFTGLAALARWDAQARPVPVAGPRLGQVALAEGARALVLDVAGPLTAVLGAAELRALAEGRGSVPAYDDPSLWEEVVAALRREPSVRAAWLGPGEGADARLTLALDPPAGAGAAAEVCRAVGRRLHAAPGWRATAVCGLDIATQGDPAAAAGSGPQAPDHRRAYTRPLD